MMMGQIVADQLSWYVVRMKQPKNRGVRMVEVNALRETYVARDGKPRVRALKGTGEKVFVQERILRRNGFEVFLPVKYEWRRKNRFVPDKHLVPFPALAGWLFVGWSSHQSRWSELARLEVVTGVLGASGQPVRISEDRMAKLMRRWGAPKNAPKAQRFMRTHAEFDVGDRVRVAQGSLEGQELDVVGFDGEGARVALHLFGRETEVTIPADTLEPVIV